VIPPSCPLPPDGILDVRPNSQAHHDGASEMEERT
jgi:hypothetical protein